MQRIITDTVTYASFLSGGEYVSQIIQNKNSHESKVNTTSIQNTAMWSIGGGAAVSLWYKYLDGSSFKNNPLVKSTLCVGSINKRMGVSNRLIVGKAVVDILFDAPLYGSYVLFKSKVEDKKMDFWSMYKTDVLFWLPVNLLNFFFVPSKYRVPVVSATTCAWAIILPMVSEGH